jgi:hypothetical protein
MSKAIGITLAALFVLFVLAGGIVLGAKSLPVPVTYIEQVDCHARAKAVHDAHPDCPKTETVWDRGLSDPVAFYTLWLTFFTLALAIGAALQGALIGRQISLAREEFIASHRPRMRVRFIKGPEPLDDDRWEFCAYLANIGESAATVKQVVFEAFQDIDGIETEISLAPPVTGALEIEIGAGLMIRDGKWTTSENYSEDEYED